VSATGTATASVADMTFGDKATASNMCGYTLMNNQVGVVIAEVLDRLDNVTVTPLPSMIRIDGVGKFALNYAEMDEAAGQEPGWFSASEFEESMSTHYGKMVHLDDQTIMFASPEESAEYTGFDLPVVNK